jgi:uncharacterized protein (DUF934 family)
MQIIKNKHYVTSYWHYIADDQPLINKDITVSLARWQWDKKRLQNHSNQVGIRINPADDIAQLVNELKYLTLIELNFSVFTDGRPFSHARLLRTALHYQGEIRAVGHYMADQAFYLAKVGVNAFQMDNADQLAITLSTLNDFSINYQPSYHEFVV